MRELKGAQNSDRWLRNRVGRITASRMADVMSVLTRKSKSGEAGEPGAGRIRYRRELIAERILGRAADHFVTRYMEEGSEREGEACAMYEAATSQMVMPVGFALHPRFDWSGASPDGILEDRVLEIKSPKPETLLEWIETAVIPENYVYQMQWEMVCCEKKFADFYGWYPGLPHFFKTLEWNDVLVSEMEAKAESLHLDVEAFLAKIGHEPTVFHDEPPFADEPPADTAYDDSRPFHEQFEGVPGLDDEIKI